jgi:ADP-ribose pyrophosphatase
MKKSDNKIPKKAKRVFKGVIFEVYQWKQRMFDGSYEIFEKLKRPDTVNMVPVAGNKIMILMQRQPDWKTDKICVPGGRIDKGEKPLDAARRELLEETGYVSSNWKSWKELNPSGKIAWTVYTFIARNCTMKQGPQPDAGERIKTKLVTFDEFLELAGEPTFYEGELKAALLRAKYDKKYKLELKKLFFGKK